MLRRAGALSARARERIRAAREHDPHAWPERDDDRAILVRDDEPIDMVEVAGGRGGRRPAPRRPRSAAPNPAPPTSTAPSARAASAGHRRAGAPTAPASAHAG